MKWGRGGSNVGYKRAREAAGLHYENPRYLAFFSKSKWSKFWAETGNVSAFKSLKEIPESIERTN
jgi:hypothetical protein